MKAKQSLLRLLSHMERHAVDRVHCDNASRRIPDPSGLHFKTLRSSLGAVGLALVLTDVMSIADKWTRN
jgi:hypothetical protein